MKTFILVLEKIKLKKENTKMELRLKSRDLASPGWRAAENVKFEDLNKKAQEVVIFIGEGVFYSDEGTSQERHKIIKAPWNT